MTTTMATQEITCRELVELVTEYLEETMDPDERARLDDHLARCTACHRFLAQMRTTIKAVGSLPEEAVTPEAQEALLDVFRAWKQAR